MQNKILNLPDIQDAAIPRPVITLSFKPFLDYIRERLHDSETIKKEIYQLILHRSHYAIYRIYHVVPTPGPHQKSP